MHHLFHYKYTVIGTFNSLAFAQAMELYTFTFMGTVDQKYSFCYGAVICSNGHCFYTVLICALGRQDTYAGSNRHCITVIRVTDIGDKLKSRYTSTYKAGSVFHPDGSLARI